jgi:hypothetical protein
MGGNAWVGKGYPRSVQLVFLAQGNLTVALLADAIDGSETRALRRPGLSALLQSFPVEG